MNKTLLEEFENILLTLYKALSTILNAKRKLNENK